MCESLGGCDCICGGGIDIGILLGGGGGIPWAIRCG